MKNIILFFILTFSFSALSENVASLTKKIMVARESLLVMMNNKSLRNIKEQSTVKNAQNDVTKALHEIEVPVQQEKKLTELKTLWKAFLKTRNDEIFPALSSNQELVAYNTVMGIQKERLDKMLTILSELQIKTPTQEK